MDKKKIEMAAKEAAMKHCAHYDEEAVFINGFASGAEWRINSVWHSTDELPKYSGFLAVLMSNGIMETMYFSVGIGFHENQLMGYVLWAYVSDILPERKEETNGGR